MLLPADPIEQATRIGALDERGLLALIAVMSMGAAFYVFRLYIKQGEQHRKELAQLEEEHRTDLSDLNERQRKELADLNEKRLGLATEFEGTIRGLYLVMKPPRRQFAPEEKK